MTDCKEISVNGKNYRVIRLLGKGKGGYSYLVTDGSQQYTLKQIHHEPCDYYKFGDKMAAELDSYQKLSAVGIPLPGLIGFDTGNERILKEFIPGDTAAELIKRGEMTDELISRVWDMCKILYQAGLNIDYYPTNFIVCGGKLVYIDYECNDYSPEWDFGNWGVKFWTGEEPI